MKSLSVRVPDDTHERIEDRADDRGTSVSAEARELIDQGFHAEDLEDDVAELRDRLESREDRIDDLERQLARRSQVEEKVDTLAKRVEGNNEPAPPWPIRWYRYFRGETSSGTGSSAENMGS